MVIWNCHLCNLKFSLLLICKVVKHAGLWTARAKLVWLSTEEQLPAILRWPCPWFWSSTSGICSLWVSHWLSICISSGLLRKLSHANSSWCCTITLKNMVLSIGFWILLLGKEYQSPSINDSAFLHGFGHPSRLGEVNWCMTKVILACDTFDQSSTQIRLVEHYDYATIWDGSVSQVSWPTVFLNDSLVSCRHAWAYTHSHGPEAREHSLGFLWIHEDAWLQGQ